MSKYKSIQSIFLGCIQSVFILFCMTFIICSCEKLSFEDEGETSGTTKSGIDVTCSITTNSIITRSVLLKDAVKRISWAILDENGKLVQNGEQTKTNNNFGNLSIDINPGEYNLVLFAHDGNESCEISNGGIITVENNKASDSFSSSTRISISKSKRLNLSIVLKRCVAKFQINSTDPVPDNVTKLHALITGVSMGYNILDSVGTEITEIDRPIIQLGSQQSGKVFNGFIYTFLPADSSKVSVRLDFLDSNNKILYSHNFESFRMQINYVSTYKGPLFINSGMDSPGISVDNEWSGQIPIEYP